MKPRRIAPGLIVLSVIVFAAVVRAATAPPLRLAGVLEPKVTETLLKLMLSAKGGKAQRGS